MNEDKRKGLAREALSRYITEHHRRCTPERFALLDKMIEMPARFTIDELCDAIQGGEFRVSKATIYNTMRLFADAGIVRKLHLDKDLWEVNIDNSPTVKLVCRSCGRIREMRDPQLINTLRLKRYQSFVIDRFEICASGLCSRCKDKGKKKK